MIDEKEEIRKQGISWMVGHIQGAFQSMKYIEIFHLSHGMPSTPFYDTPSFKRTLLVVEVLKEEIMKRRIE